MSRKNKIKSILDAQAAEAILQTEQKRRRLHLAIAGAVIACLVAIGVLAKSGWLDQSNSLTASSSESGSSLNPFAAAAVPSPTPATTQLTKEYVYAGSRMLAIDDGLAERPAPTDLVVWRASTGSWYVLGNNGQQSTGVTSQNWGTAGDQPAAGDYDGDNKTDFCVFRESAGAWYILRSSDSTLQPVYFGMNGDIAKPADYDGDGKTDAAVVRTQTGTGKLFWHILQSSNGATVTRELGVSGDKLAPADYDGDGRADVAVFRSGQFLVQQSSANYAQFTQNFGSAGDDPVTGDYDGDGRFDYAVRRPSENNWYILKSSTNSLQAYYWGASTDQPITGDYDADGKTDVAVYRDGAYTGQPSYWYILKSSDLQMRAEQWGMHGDRPVPAPFRRY